MNDDKGLLYIPDISGFTKFVTQTEKKHSNHIIQELIEVILDSNSIDLRVSEIEGDAVLFYRPGPAPSLSELVRQTKQMFVNFHSYLRIIERDRICQCGACSSASKLTLKFITHYGELEEVSIQNFKKIMGSDVILAHRLLKNDISDSEYLLYTSHYKGALSDSANQEEWIVEKSYSEEIENFGNIDSTYIGLSVLKQQLPEIPPVSPTEPMTGEADVVTYIEAPILFVHDALTVQEHKWEYVEGIKDIRGSEDINRLNASHTCVFDDLEVHFVTTGHSAGKEQMSFTERAEIGKGVAFTNYYKLKSVGNGTEVSFYLIQDNSDDEKKNFISNLLTPLKNKIIRKKILQATRKGQEQFRAYCERKYKEQENSSN